MKCTASIIEKRNELNLLDWEAREVMQVLHTIQGLNKSQQEFLSFALGKIVRELSENVR